MATAPMFCVPNTSDSVFPDRVGQWGFGCGNGVCAPSGQFCVCEASHEHSSFLFQLQDCWDPKGTQVGILVATSLLILPAMAYCFWLARKTRAEVRITCILAGMCNFNMAASNLTLFLEGFNGIATVILFCSGVFFGMSAIGRVSWMFLRPSLRMSGKAQLARRALIPTLFVPASLFYAFMATEIPAYAVVVPFPADSNLIEFNRRMTGFFFAASILPFLVCFAPLLYMLVLFERVFVQKSDSRSADVADSKTSGVREASGAAALAPSSPSPPHSSSGAQAQSMRTSALLSVLRSFTWMIFGLLLVNTIICLYLATHALMFNQAPMQMISFIAFKLYGPLLAILIRFFIRRAQKSMDNNKEGDAKATNIKSTKSKEELVAPSELSKVGSTAYP